MKKVMLVLVLMCCFVLPRAEAQTIPLYLLKGIIQAEERAPSMQVAIKKCSVALAKYKDKKPTMYYITGAGVKKEAIDDELLRLVAALSTATEEVRKSAKIIEDKKTLWRQLYKLTNERKFKIVYARVKKAYLKNEKLQQEKEAKTHARILASGKYTPEEFADYWLRRTKAQANAEMEKDIKMEFQIKKLLEKRNRSRRNRQQEMSSGQERYRP